MTMETPQLLVRRCRGQRTAPGDISCPGEPLGLPVCPPTREHPQGSLLSFSSVEISTQLLKVSRPGRGDTGGQQGPVPSSFLLGDTPHRPTVTKVPSPNGTQHRD